MKKHRERSGCRASEQAAEGKDKRVHGLSSPHHRHCVSAVHHHRAAGPGDTGAVPVRRYFADRRNGAVYFGCGHVHDPHG